MIDVDVMSAGGVTVRGSLMPSLFSLLRIMFPGEQQRRLAIAIMFSAFSVGGAIGPLLGGALLEHFWWGSVFLVNVPPMALLVLAGRRLLPERQERTPVRIDIPSVALSVAGMLAVVYGLQELAAGQDGAGAAAGTNLAIVAGGVALLAVFVWRQRRLHDPLFDLTLLTDRRVVAALAALLIVGIGVVGVFYLFTQHLQWVVGLSPLRAGLWTLPYIALNIAGALIAPGLATRFGAARTVAAGLAIAALAAAAIAVLTGASLGLLVAAIAVVGLGQGGAMALISDLIIASAPAAQTGSAAAAQEGGGELGAALGIAASGAIGLLIYRAALPGLVPRAVPNTVVSAAHASVHDGFVVAERSVAHGETLIAAVRAAVTQGLEAYAAVAAVLVACAAALITVLLVRRRDTQDTRTSRAGSAPDKRPP